MICTQTDNSYKKGCRCEPCKDAHRTSRRDYDRARRRPDSDWYPKVVKRSPEAAREHMLWLHDKGVGIVAVNKACGVDIGVLADVRDGKKVYLEASTEARILGVGLNRAPSYAMVRERVTSMLAKGWTQEELADLSGLSISTISEISRACRRKVWSQTAERVLGMDPTMALPDR